MIAMSETGHKPIENLPAIPPKNDKKPVYSIQDLNIATAFMSGMSQSDIARQHKLSRVTIWKRLNQPHIKQYIERETKAREKQRKMIVQSLIPKAGDTYHYIIDNKELDPNLAYKASKDILMPKEVLPSSTHNTQVNISDSELNLMPDSLRQLLGGVTGKREEIIEADIIDE